MPSLCLPCSRTVVLDGEYSLTWACPSSGVLAPGLLARSLACSAPAWPTAHLPACALTHLRTRSACASTHLRTRSPFDASACSRTRPLVLLFAYRPLRPGRPSAVFVRGVFALCTCGRRVRCAVRRRLLSTQSARSLVYSCTHLRQHSGSPLFGCVCTQGFDPAVYPLGTTACWVVVVVPACARAQALSVLGCRTLRDSDSEGRRRETRRALGAHVHVSAWRHPGNCRIDLAFSRSQSPPSVSLASRLLASLLSYRR